MREYFFTVDELPDLSLAKYAGLDTSGASGVINRHNAFLKQLHTIGELKQMSFHLFYAFNHEEEKGRRLILAILCRVGVASDQNKTSEEEASNIHSLLNSTALGEFFAFKYSEKNPLPTRKYSAQSFLARTITHTLSDPSGSSTNQEKYFGVSKWKQNDSARLYNVIKLLQQINTDIVYRIDIFPVNFSEKIRNDTSAHMRLLSDRMKFKSSSDGTEVSRDENAEAAYRGLKDFCGNISQSVHFLANITALSEDAAIGRIILEYAASEIVKEGSFESTFECGSFDCCSHIECPSFDVEKMNVPNLSSTKHLSYLLQLKYLSQIYTVDDIKGFFSLPVLFNNENIELRKESDPHLQNGDIQVGIDKNEYSVFIPLKSFTKHAYISGVPGSGKTYTMKHLITSLWIDNEIPVLIFEPAKREYRELLQMDNYRMRKMILFSPGANTHFPLFINPFEVPQGITVSDHITSVVNIFQGAFDLPSPLPILLNKAIEQAYTEHGWNFYDYGGRDTHSFPMMSEVYTKVEYILEHSTYGVENMGNLKAMLQTRIGSLLSREKGDVFDVPISTLSPEQWVQYTILIELECLGRDTANFLTLLISTIVRETLRANPVIEKNKDLRHVIFFEEAHNLIGRTSEVSKEAPDAKASSTGFIVNMLSEVRALKEGIVIADQLPSSIAPQVLKSTSFKLAHRQMSADERQLLGQVMSADATQLEKMAKFSSGRALMMYEGSDGSDNILKPFEIQVTSKYEFSSDTPDSESLNEMLKTNEQRIKISLINYRVMASKITLIFTTLCKYRPLIDESYNLSVSEMRNRHTLLLIKQVMSKFLDNKNKLDNCVRIFNKLIEDIDGNFSVLPLKQQEEYKLILNAVRYAATLYSALCEKAQEIYMRIRAESSDLLHD